MPEAEVKQNLYIDSDNLFKIEGLINFETSNPINDATITMSLFKEVVLNIDICEIAFTSGGVGELLEGDVVKGSIGNATATISSIDLTSGAWADGDAVGILYLLSQFGTFQAEDLNVIGGQANIASIAGDSTGSTSEAAGAKTGLLIRGHSLSTDDYVRIQGTKNFDDEWPVDTVVQGKVTINTSHIAERFNGTEKVYVGIENGVDISLTHGGGDPDGYYDGILLSTLLELVHGAWYYLFVNIIDGSNKLTLRFKCLATYSPE